jgi:hypothetical protein
MGFKLSLAAGVLIFSGALFAHHGTNASYDMDKVVTMTGTVTEFVWTNPHCELFFDVKDDKGNVVRWGGETNSPGVLREAGFSKNFVKPGDQIKISVHPSKAGTPFGVVTKIVLPDGSVFERGAGEAR